MNLGSYLGGEGTAVTRHLWEVGGQRDKETETEEGREEDETELCSVNNINHLWEEKLLISRSITS